MEEEEFYFKLTDEGAKGVIGENADVQPQYA